jgi:pimeloyl-ACP methyl ester carboxylesterase
MNSQVTVTGKSRIQISGFEVDIIERGNGRPLLFLHGGEGPLFPSDRYLERLAESFRVIAPWHPGFGLSSLPDDVSKIEDLAYFYLDLAKHLDLQNAVLVGASFGGWVAAETAVRSTQRFSKLILVDPLGVKVGTREERAIADIFAVSSWDWPQLFYHDPEKGQVDFSAYSDDDLMGIARSREALALFGWKPYMHNPALKRWLHRIDIPTLVIWGAEDKVVSTRYGECYRSEIPYARMEIIEHAGHFPHIERPDEFARCVKTFCRLSKEN